MTRLTAFSSPLLLGFEDIEQALERLSKAAVDGYPPYNIERVAKSADRPEILRIVLAVAGFSGDDLDITVVDRELTIRGQHGEVSGRDHGFISRYTPPCICGAYRFYPDLRTGSIPTFTTGVLSLAYPRL